MVRFQPLEGCVKFTDCPTKASEDRSDVACAAARLTGTRSDVSLWKAASGCPLPCFCSFLALLRCVSHRSDDASKRRLNGGHRRSASMSAFGRRRQTPPVWPGEWHYERSGRSLRCSSMVLTAIKVTDLQLGSSPCFLDGWQWLPRLEWAGHSGQGCTGPVVDLVDVRIQRGKAFRTFFYSKLSGAPVGCSLAFPK